MFFDKWLGLLRVLVITPLAYGALVLMLRVSGKRTLSKMNAFDLVVTIALGSTFATVLLTNNVALSEGLLAFALLIGLQWVVAWLSVRSAKWRGLVKSEPKLLVLRGELLEAAMREERISADDVRAAVRSQGGSSLQDIAAVVLEADGSFSVITSLTEGQTPSALTQVNGFPKQERG